MRKFILLFIFVSCKSVSPTLNVGATKVKNYYSEIDFEWISNTIIVPVELNGKTYRFMLDTGAPNTISKEVYDIMKPKVLDSIPIRDSNNMVEKMPLVSVKNTVFGGISFENVATLVYDFKKVPTIDCFQLDGIIGSNMLRNSIIQINLETKKVILTDNKKKLHLTSHNSQKMKFLDTQSTPFIWVNLKGKSEEEGKEQVLIDTGASSLYTLSKEHFEVFKNNNVLNSTDTAEGFSSIGIFGKPKIDVHNRVLLSCLKINNFTIKNHLVETSNDSNSKIGVNLIKYGIITLDYINKRFYFNSKNKEINLKSKHYGYYGFSEHTDGDKLIVTFVWDKDLKNKLHYGDEILEINGEKFDFCDYVLGKKYFNNETSLKMKIKSTKGKVFEIIVFEK